MPQDRKRNTPATRARVANFTRLIASLRLQNMLRDDFTEFLGMSPSGARKYILELRQAAVIVVAGFVDPTHNYEGQPVYALVNNEFMIQAFIETIALPAPPSKVKPSSRLLTSSDDPTRHVHIMRDDVDHPIKVNGFRIPAPDPVLAHLFGRAGSGA